MFRALNTIRELGRRIYTICSDRRTFSNRYRALQPLGGETLISSPNIENNNHFNSMNTNYYFLSPYTASFYPKSLIKFIFGKNTLFVEINRLVRSQNFCLVYCVSYITTKIISNRKLSSRG